MVKPLPELLKEIMKSGAKIFK